jgi:type VI secretion system secreted protein Hcp
MAFSICMKLGTIKGESKGDSKGNHKDEIDVLSWNWGLTQSASGHVGSGAGSGMADVKDLSFTKYLDVATPTLLQECKKGSDQKEAVLTVLKASGDTPLDFVKITLSGTVIISSVHTGDPLPGDRYSETVTLNFSHVKFEYTLQTGTQGKGATSVGEFSVDK